MNMNIKPLRVNVFTGNCTEEVKIIPWKKLTVKMQRLQNYTFILGKKLLEKHVEVSFTNDKSLPWKAYFRELAFGREVIFNIAHLGVDWFRRGNINEVDFLILDVFSHEFEKNHLSLGAKLKEEALKDPEWFGSIFTMKPRLLGVFRIPIEAMIEPT